MRPLPPALAATATPRIVEPDPARAEQARQREACVAERAEGRFDAVVALAGTELTGIDAAGIVLVDERGRASMAR